jgi:hypothetical protein
MTASMSKREVWPNPISPFPQYRKRPHQRVGTPTPHIEVELPETEAEVEASQRPPRQHTSEHKS